MVWLLVPPTRSGGRYSPRRRRQHLALRLLGRPDQGKEHEERHQLQDQRQRGLQRQLAGRACDLRSRVRSTDAENNKHTNERAVVIDQEHARVHAPASTHTRQGHVGIVENNGQPDQNKPTTAAAQQQRRQRHARVFNTLTYPPESRNISAVALSRRTQGR